MEGRSRMVRGGSTGGGSGRRPKRKGSKKRPQSAMGGARGTVGEEGCGTESRYRSTSFPLFSGHAATSSFASDSDSEGGRGAVGGEAGSCMPVPVLISDDRDCFPFSQLPEEMKLKVFSYLSSCEKGRAARVCLDWWRLMRTPVLWSAVAFSEFPLCCLPDSDHKCTASCYDCYRARVHAFARFLVDVKPVLRRFEFCFDIGNNQDRFLAMIEEVLDAAVTQDMRKACLNWHQTPCRMFWLDPNRTFKCEEAIEFHQAQRHRQRLFVHFFTSFVKQAPNLTTLIMPFDWSEPSVSRLGQLHNLHSLVLERYQTYQRLEQGLLDQFLSSLPKLRRLMLEVWTPSGQGLIKYSMQSHSLEFLDISQCRGFYLQALLMPALRRIRVVRRPWNGPLVLSEVQNLPCLHGLLAEGTPNLRKLNEHYLQENWRWQSYPALEDALRDVCACSKHKTSWGV